MVHLTYLERLDIFSNPGLAEFPLLKGMPWLKYLGLHYCQLESTIPEWIGTLTKLETLALSNNFLTGTLPKSMSTMARLEKLYVDDNNLEGDIGFLGSIPSLRHVVVEDNMFTGGLSDELFLNLPLLEVFDASKNPIDSTIPASLMALEKLRVLDCHSCNLHGSIPSFNDPNFQNTALEVLVLASNSLTGSIPEQISNYMGLRQLDLSKNQLAFTIPSSLANLQKLEYFYAALNNFEPGEIPTFLYTMTNLKDLSLKATSRIGSIPEAIGSLSQLTMLDLDSNDLVSSIPTAIGKLTSLEYLLLNRNMLQGTLPPDLELLSKLGESLALSDNSYYGGLLCFTSLSLHNLTSITPISPQISL